MSKMVINHLEKLFVTKDANTIMTELEVQHPAAKLLVLSAMAQEKEIGDGTNFVSRTLPQDHALRMLRVPTSALLASVVSDAMRLSNIAPGSFPGRRAARQR